MWKSKRLELIDMQRHAEVCYLLGFKEVRSGTGYCVAVAVFMTTQFIHTHMDTSHRYVPGSVGNPAIAKKLSRPLCSAISITRFDQAQAASKLNCGGVLGLFRAHAKVWVFPLSLRHQASLVRLMDAANYCCFRAEKNIFWSSVTKK